MNSTTSLRQRTSIKSTSSSTPLPPAVTATTATSSSSFLHSPGSSQLSTSLLHLIDLCTRHYISSWYTTAISRDEELIVHIRTISLHVIQILELRCDRIHFLDLLLVDLVHLLSKHYEDYDRAWEMVGSGYANHLDAAHLFHHLQPHLALVVSPDAAEIKVDPVYSRAWVDQVLKLCLPEEDYTAETERSMIKEIVVNLILEGVFEKVARPWFIHRLIGDILEGMEHDEEQDKGNRRSRLSSVTSFFHTLSSSFSNSTASTAVTADSPSPSLVTPLLSFLHLLLPLSPILVQLIHYIQIIINLFTPSINSVIARQMRQRVLNIEMVERVVEITTKSLFPNGQPAMKEPDPDPAAQEALKRRSEAAIVRLIPGQFISRF